MSKTRNDGEDMKRERLERVLEAYGSDPLRWPESDRAALAGYHRTRNRTESSEARRAWQEAVALDDLLARANSLAAEAPPPMALADRIAAAAVAQSRATEIVQPASKPEAQIIAFPNGARQQDQISPRAHGPRATHGNTSLGMRSSLVAAALAASLIVGIFAGANGLLQSTLWPVGEVVALVSPVETQAAILEEAWGSDGEGLL